MGGEGEERVHQRRPSEGAGVADDAKSAAREPELRQLVPDAVPAPDAVAEQALVPKLTGDYAPRAALGHVSGGGAGPGPCILLLSEPSPHSLHRVQKGAKPRLHDTKAHALNGLPVDTLLNHQSMELLLGPLGLHLLPLEVHTPSFPRPLPLERRPRHPFFSF